MRSHPPSAPVQENACRLLASLLAGSWAEAATARQLGLIGDVRTAMRAHPGSAAVQQPACSALAGSMGATASRRNSGEAAASGFLADLQRAMHDHIASEGVQEQVRGRTW